MAEGLIDVFVIRDEKLDDFISYINVLRDEVTWLHSMDILILALALVDEECHGLVTLDSKITEPRKIKAHWLDREYGALKASARKTPL